MLRKQKFWARALRSVYQALQVVLIHALENYSPKSSGSGHGLYFFHLQIPFLHGSASVVTNAVPMRSSDVGLPGRPESRPPSFCFSPPPST